MRISNVLVSETITVTVAGTAAYCIRGSNTAPAGSAESRLLAADREPQNWLTYGHTYNEQHFSPLASINASNAGRLGLAWYHDLGTGRGEEATPLEVDGVIYVSTAWSIVKAFDARNGAALWTYDPQVPRERLAQACCDDTAVHSCHPRDGRAAEKRLVRRRFTGNNHSHPRNEKDKPCRENRAPDAQ